MRFEGHNACQERRVAPMSLGVCAMACDLWLDSGAARLGEPRKHSRGFGRGGDR